jgi:hypothetical protein
VSSHGRRSNGRFRVLIAALAATALFGAAAADARIEQPRSVAANPIEIFQDARQAWKDSDEAQALLKLARKFVAPKLRAWRSTGGASCPWRGSLPGLCANGRAVVIGEHPLLIHGVWVGTLRNATTVTTACVRGNRTRILWPTSWVPSIFVSSSFLLFVPGENPPAC